MQEEVLQHHLLLSYFLINSSVPRAWTALVLNSTLSVRDPLSFPLGTAPNSGGDAMQYSNSWKLNVSVPSSFGALRDTLHISSV